MQSEVKEEEKPDFVDGSTEPKVGVRYVENYESHL